MKIQDKTFSKLFNLFLSVIAATIILRMPCTMLLVGFVVFNLVFIKKIQLSKKALWLGVIIALPFLLELLFFWSNSSVSAGLKSAEKTVSMVLFPLFILGNYRHVDLNKVLFYFGRLIMLVMVVCLIRFVILFPDLIQNYLNGINLFETGYIFASSFKSHAPATNMHLAFAAIVNFYIALSAFQQKKPLVKKVIALFFVGLSLFFVLLVNTRLALGTMIIGFGIVLVYEMLKAQNGRRILLFAGVAAVVMGGIFYIYLENNPYMKQKYTSDTFQNLDKVGRLDEFAHPEVEVYQGLVTRLSVWKSCGELALRHLPFGVGSSDVKDAIKNYYKETNQQFLYREAFPAHNQLIDMTIRFGLVGALGFLLHVCTIGWLGLKTRHAVILSFFTLFFLSNMVDDFLIRFDGIVFSALWFSVFGAYWLQQKQAIAYTAPEGA
jgi:O-antigen ligase